MARLARRMMMYATMATIALAVAWSAAGAPEKAVPTVVALASDDHTRGDWIGTYGS